MRNSVRLNKLNEYQSMRKKENIARRHQANHEKIPTNLLTQLPVDGSGITERQDGGNMLIVASCVDTKKVRFADKKDNMILPQ